MKQVPLTTEMRTRLQAAVGDTVEIGNLAVYEAIALNTRPVRKNHPMYIGGTHGRRFLEQMTAQLSNESLPLYIQHNSEPLPVGRIFHGEVLDNDTGSELRVLFWIDRSQGEILNLVDNGTVDQVSVSVVAKKVACNMCGFDFLGEKATIDNIWTGTCDEGHVMGQDGAHVVMNDLSRWFEMSLVGQGGIPGARIVSGASSVLAASGDALPLTVLTLSSDQLGKLSMDLTALISELTDNKAKVATLTASEAALKAQLDAANAKIAELSAREPEKVVEKVVDETAMAALTDIAKHVLTIQGKATDAVPTEVDGIVALVKEAKLSLTSGKSKAADSNSEDTPGRLAPASFKIR